MLLPFLSMVLAAADPIGIYLAFDSDPDVVSLDQMKAEVEGLLAPSGIRVDWRTIEQASLGESFSQIYVLKFRGRCDPRGIQLLFSELGPYGEAMAFGEAHTERGRVQPFGSLGCDEIRRSVAPALKSKSATDRETLFGRAMGRVAAHELYHMMTGETRHGQRGVFKASHRRGELVSAKFEFDEPELERLRALHKRN